VRLKLAYGREELWIEYPEGAPVDVARALDSVKETRSGANQGWFDTEGRLRTSLTVFVNGENIRYRKGLETELNDGDEVYVIPMIAGG
jgi:molybdopterin synthase sulfur carrier subunit